MPCWVPHGENAPSSNQAVTRGQTTSMLALPTVKSRFGYHSIAFLAADRWNSLPSHCRLCESSAHFIHIIKSLLGYPVIS